MDLRKTIAKCLEDVSEELGELFAVERVGITIRDLPVLDEEGCQLAGIVEKLEIQLAKFGAVPNP